MAVATPTVTLLVVLLRAAGILQPLEWRAYDRYLQWRPEETDPRIAIVGSDEEGIRQQGPAILSDGDYAAAIRKLAYTWRCCTWILRGFPPRQRI